ncbi:MAG: hypothetical protein NC086_05095 [Alistipes sp.]|nr:hypothetical protein [Alistipes sp.]
MASITIKGTDTVIRTSSPDTNYDSRSTLEFGSSSGTANLVPYLFFKIPDVLKGDVEINSITLHIEKYSYEVCKKTWSTNSSGGQYTNLSYSNPSGMSGDYGVIKGDADLSSTMTYNNDPYQNSTSFTAYYWDRFSVSQGNNTDVLDIPIRIQDNSGNKIKLDSNYLILCFTGYYTGTNAYGLESTWYYGAFRSNTANLTIDYSSKKPRATLTSPLNIAINNANEIEFIWTYEDDRKLEQSKYEFGYSYDNVNWTTTIENLPDTSYHVQPDKFSAGNVYWRVKVFNTEGFESEYAYGVFTSVLNVPVLTLTYPVEVSLNQASPLTFTWDYFEEVEVGQKSYEIGWSSDGGANWSTVSIASSEHYHEYPADTFPGGIIRWRVRSTNNYNKTSEYVYGVFTSVLNIPVVTVSYPNEVNLNNSSKSIFTWDYTEEVLVGQKSYEIGWSSDDGGNWHTANVTAGRHYHEYPADTFPVGAIRWRIRATNNYNKRSGYSYGQFTAIGQTAAPVITSVSQDAIPTVTWTSQYQDCYEIRIRQGSGILYESGLMTGSSVRELQCNVMLPDGVYSVEIRMVNTYGYYTEWNTYSYALDTVKPQAAQMVEISRQKDFSIKISGIVPAGLKAYVIRKDAVTNEEVIIGIYSEEEEFYDYSAPLDQDFLYTIRTYDASRPGGYTDGEWTRQRIGSGGGIVLHDAANMKNCIAAYISGDNLFEIGRNDTYTKNFFNVIGRKYPVKEQMDWVRSQREVSVWLSDADYEKIQKINMSSGNVYYRAQKEAFLCDMEIQLTGRYVGGGKFLKISLLRLNEDLEVKLL